ncbi:MAG TPA: extensin family protein, partial [Sphingomonas sp.]|nr:extensin family protein [Sphingomonas sp.]
QRIDFSPARLGVSCPVAAALAMWEWNVVQPAAQRHFGQPVATIEHLGSYSCRRMYGRSVGDWSEHATADALDVAGFRLADGKRIRVLADWEEGGAKAAFLHEVRDGACRLFSTVLSPDYNAAHRDHLHLDQAERGEMGWRACR